MSEHCIGVGPGTVSFMVGARIKADAGIYIYGRQELVRLVVFGVLSTVSSVCKIRTGAMLDWRTTDISE